MVLPKIFEKILKKKEKELEYFLALLFTEDKIKAAVWKKEGEKGEIIGQAEKETTENWPEKIKDADEVITKASADIPQEKIRKVIFGLPPSWVFENKIREPYLSNLRKLTSELTLTPIGFIVTDEAIINFLSKREGAPATVILIGFKKEKFSLILSRIGKIKGIKEKERKSGVALCEEIAKTLQEFSEIDVLPSKILLYDEKEDLEGVKQELISYPWLTKAEFLHFPKIEILENSFDLRALVFSAAMEMGIKIETQEKYEEHREEEKQKEGESAAVEEQEERGIKMEEKEESKDFGFLKDKDIVEEIPTAMPDLTKIKEKEEVFLEKQVSQERKVKFPSLSFNFPKVPKLNFEFLFNFKSYGMIIAGILIFLLVLSVLAYWRLPHAKVILLVTPKILEKEEEVIVDPNITVLSLEKRKIPGFEVKVTEKGTKSIKTTGKKIVGEKARGEVTIFNKTNYSKKFPAGTVLIGPNNLKFSLNEDVTVASQSSTTSSDESVILTPGKAKVKVTALTIGAESNLAKDTEFRIEDYSVDDYKAKNENDAFSGGLSREVSVVSGDDQQKLLTLLTGELSKKARSELKNKVKGGGNLIENSLETRVVSKRFSQEVGEETDEITLDLSLEFKALSYSNLDLENILLKLIDKTVPEDFDYKKEEVTKEIKESRKEKDRSVVMKMYFKINLLPKIDTEKIKKELAGKSVKVATVYLNKIPSVVGFEAKISPKFPGFLYTFPRIANNPQF